MTLTDPTPTEEMATAVDSTGVASVVPTTLEPPETRGRLEIRPRVFERIAGRLVDELSGGTANGVHVVDRGDTGVELAVSLDLPYPAEPINAVLARIRKQVSGELTRLVGRPVLRLDFTVDRLVVRRVTRRRLE